MLVCTVYTVLGDGSLTLVTVFPLALEAVCTSLLYGKGRCDHYGGVLTVQCGLCCFRHSDGQQLQALVFVEQTLWLKRVPPTKRM